MAPRYYVAPYSGLVLGNGYWVYDHTDYQPVPGYFHKTLEGAQEDAKKLNQDDATKRQEQEAP